MDERTATQKQTTPVKKFQLTQIDNPQTIHYDVNFKKITYGFIDDKGTYVKNGW